MSQYAYSSTNKGPTYELDDMDSFSDWASSFSCRWYGSETNSASCRMRTKHFPEDKAGRVLYRPLVSQLPMSIYEYLSVLDLYTFMKRCLDLMILLLSKIFQFVHRHIGASSISGYVEAVADAWGYPDALHASSCQYGRLSHTTRHLLDPSSAKLYLWLPATSRFLLVWV